jgi:hypothetical protein
MKPERLGWLTTLRPSLSYVVLATLAMLGLLLAFHQVVLGAVHQGEMRRKATAMQTEAAWRCKVLPATRLQEGCLLQLKATPPVRDGATEANLASLSR